MTRTRYPLAACSSRRELHNDTFSKGATPTREIERGGMMYCLPIVMRPTRVKRPKILDIVSPFVGHFVLFVEAPHFLGAVKGDTALEEDAIKPLMRDILGPASCQSSLDITCIFPPVPSTTHDDCSVHPTTSPSHRCRGCTLA